MFASAITVTESGHVHVCVYVCVCVCVLWRGCWQGGDKVVWVMGMGGRGGRSCVMDEDPISSIHVSDINPV